MDHPKIEFVLALVTLLLHLCDASRGRLMTTMSMKNNVGWLVDPSESIYNTQILRLAKESTIQALKNDEKLLEIEFPTTRGNDPSVTQTLDNTRLFTKSFIADPFFSKLGPALWIVFPDNKEANLARKAWGGDKTPFPFILTSIESCLTAQAQAVASSTPPSLIVAVSPGFNIPEWIDIEKVHTLYPASAILTINGNLERLRNGYYPSFFYPGLAKTTDRFYRKFKQCIFLNPIAVGGDRLGAWLFKSGVQGPWEVFVKTKGARGVAPCLECVSESPDEPNASEAWRTASRTYKERNGNTF